MRCSARASALYVPPDGKEQASNVVMTRTQMGVCRKQSLFLAARVQCTLTRKVRFRFSRRLVRIFLGCYAAEDGGGSRHFWNIGKHLPDYMAQQFRGQSSSSTRKCGRVLNTSYTVVCTVPIIHLFICATISAADLAQHRIIENEHMIVWNYCG